MKFYICKHCGNIIAYVRSSGVPVVCCGEPMQEIIPGTTDGALEKHVPVIEVEGNKVTVRVGAVEHPMLPEHYIEWIALETAQGNQRKPLAPGQKPEAVFMLAEGDSVVAAYEYCNLHSSPLRRAGPSAHRVIQKTCPVPEGMGRVFYFHRSVSARTSLPGTAGSAPPALVETAETGGKIVSGLFNLLVSCAILEKQRRVHLCCTDLCR